MKKAKLKKENKETQKTLEYETYSIKNLILIILIVSVVFGTFYLITYLLVEPQKQDNSSNGVTQIDSTKITLNHLLDRNKDEYYVLVTKENKTSQVDYLKLYNNYINSYNNMENSLSFYYVDLDDALNKNYISDELKISNDLSKLKLNDETLFRIKNKKIEEYYVGSEDIIEYLKDLSN